jgi:hypothetical protein
VVLRGRETRFEPPEVVSPWAVTALWGSGPDDVWATAAGGSCQIFRWDGQRWRARSPIEGDLPCDCTLSTIWGSGPRDVWAGGCKGILIRFDGAAWRRIPLGPDWETRTIRAIWGRGPTEVWAAAANGSTGDRPVVLRFDGKTWTPFRSEQPLVRIAGTGEGRIWGVDARGRVGTLDLH